MKIGMASDHAGVELKQYLLDFLKEKGCEVSDFGTNSTESCDYPDFAHPLAEAVEQNKCDYGIAICGSGNGISMTLNKHQQVRAALCWDTPLAELARQHNDANILSLPARFISTEKAVEMVLAFFSTDFEGGRHQNRVDKIAVK
ncbi:MAG: ribose 5-phosphate isomerase B [Paludibacteraceae bacterium]|nr:ribose 5-phosphate isomerase B [Paludibacteraceae bacterium]